MYRFVRAIGAFLLVGGWGLMRFAVEKMNAAPQIQGGGRYIEWTVGLKLDWMDLLGLPQSSSCLFAMGVGLMAIGAFAVGCALPTNSRKKAIEVKDSSI